MFSDRHQKNKKYDLLLNMSSFSPYSDREVERGAVRVRWGIHLHTTAGKRKARMGVKKMLSNLEKDSEMERTRGGS